MCLPADVRVPSLEGTVHQGGVFVAWATPSGPVAYIKGSAGAVNLSMQCDVAATCPCSVKQLLQHGRLIKD